MTALRTVVDGVGIRASGHSARPKPVSHSPHFGRREGARLDDRRIVVGKLEDIAGAAQFGMRVDTAVQNDALTPLPSFGQGAHNAGADTEPSHSDPS